MVRRAAKRNGQRRNKKKRQALQVDSKKQAEEYCDAFIDRIRMNSFC